MIITVQSIFSYAKNLFQQQKDEDENIIISNEKEILKDLKSILHFFGYFKDNNEILQKDWIKLNDICNNFSEISETKKKLIELKEEGIYDYKEEIDKKSHYILLFNLLFEKSQALDILNKYKVEDIKALYDKIYPFKENTNLVVISNINDCCGFFQKVKDIKGGLKEIINNFKLMEKDENLSLLNSFNKFLDVYPEIIKLIVNSENIVSSFNEEISSIIKNSIFIFNKNKIELKIINKEVKVLPFERFIKLKKLCQLEMGRNKNLFLNNDKVDDKSETNYLKIKFFLALCNNIEEIYNLMSRLRKIGSTLPILINIEISYPKVKYLLYKKEKDLNYILKFLSNVKMDIISKIDSNYKKMINIRFMFGKQFDNMVKHIYENFSLDSFLRYILNYTFTDQKIYEGKKDFNKVKFDYNNIEKYNENTFKIINEYMNNFFKENNSSIENFYKTISIKEGNNLKGIYIYLSQSGSIEEDIITIFVKKIQLMPIAQNILIISKETTYEEMQTFFNRSILCEYNTLFMTIITDSCCDYQKKCMNNIINDLLFYKSKIFKEKHAYKYIELNDTGLYMDSCLIFICEKNNEFFLFELEVFNPKEFKLYNTQNHLLAKIEPENDPFMDALFNVHVIQSEISGLGKSTKIKKCISETKKTYIYFPLGGNLTKEFIFSKLNNIMNDINIKTKYNYKDIAIHLDLFESKEHSVLNDFLFSSLITKFYSYNENIIYIPSDIEIYIEIPNCFYDFIDNHKLLNFFQKEIITLNNLQELDLSKDKINFFKNMLGLDTNHKIYKWIKERFNLEIYSYYQINILINLFLSQFDIFKEKKVIFFQKGEDMTYQIINSFISSIEYFINRNISESLRIKYTENSKYDLINILSKGYENVLKYQEFDKKIIFISKTKMQYYNLDISTKALKKGEALECLDSFEKERREKTKKELPLHYFEKLEYLNILKKILGLKNPVTPDDLDKNLLISLLSIIEKDDYVITTDTFRKMVLIIYRIRANIPVILIGERGCGKTLLIKKLNQLLNNGKEKLEYINILQNNTYVKIIKMMDEINTKVKLNENKDEVWLFFDELNMCDSFNLITEIFNNRTYNGQKIEDNIRLIGSYIPYIKIRHGINYYNDKNNELIDFSNILPQSLMHLVLNFCILDKEIEEEYIESIISYIFSDKKLREAVKNIIINCHEFLRKNSGYSIVSLEDIIRFKKLYFFSIEYYNNKKKLNVTKGGTDESNKLKSIIISIYLCYYIRLDDIRTRTIFEYSLKKYFIKLVNYKYDEYSNEYDLICDGDLKNDLKFNYNICDFNNFSFSYILFSEEDFLLDNINLNKGIGKTRPLKESIFLIFTSLITNIPLIVIGKSGTSKTLSAQLIFKEMLGKQSKNKFFQFYPKINQTYFQCSNSTSSEDVDNILLISKERMNDLSRKNKMNKNLPISVILFDSLELLEQKEYNLLNVLQNQIEFGSNIKNLRFIGFSNSKLDNSIMNKTLFLSVSLESNLDELKIISLAIAEGINEDNGKRTIFRTIVPNVYFHFKEALKLLKLFIVYKEYISIEYKNIIDKYKEDKDFIKIFKDINEFKSNKENKKIFEYEFFIKAKNKLKQFLRLKNDDKDVVFSENLFYNEKFKKLYEKDKKILEDCFGLRDYYYLIKGIAKELEKNKDMDVNIIIKKNIERNLGKIEIEVDLGSDYKDLLQLEEIQGSNCGIYYEFFDEISKRKQWFSSQIFELIYNNYCKSNEYYDYILEETDLDNANYVQNIIDNLKNINSRNLLLIIKPSEELLIQQMISKKLNKNIYFHKQSPFVNDDNNEYHFDIINKIINHIEKGDIVILQNLNQIYELIYDIFDKNYIEVNKKQYIRIHHKLFFEQLFLIKKEFKVIIFVDQNNLGKFKPSFLERFEKMFLTFFDFISDSKKQLINKIASELDISKSLDKPKFEKNYRLIDLLIGCHRENILEKIYYELMYNEKTINDEKKIKEDLISQICKLFPQDIIVNLDENNKIAEKYYSQKKYFNLVDYLIDNLRYKISIIYTFNDINTRINGLSESSSIKNISEIENGRQLKEIINTLLLKRNLIFIHFDENNLSIISFLIPFIFNEYNNNENIKFIFIAHIKRNFLFDKPKQIFIINEINHDVNQLFIDNLNGYDIGLNDLTSNLIQKLIDKGIINIEDELGKFEDYFNKKVNYNLKEPILEKINSYINEQNDKLSLNNILDNIYKLRYINKDHVDIISVIIEFIRKEILYKYFNTIIKPNESNYEQKISFDINSKKKDILSINNNEIDDDFDNIKEENIKLKNKNKKLKEIISRFPFKLSENEYILSLILITKDKNVIFSVLCKNTDKFIKVEKKFYKEHPEYLEKKGNFKIRDKLIDKNETIEESKLKNNDIVIFEEF